MMANRYNKLLVTTCNASEDAVGYCTMDGDTCGGVAPIGDISKSRILKINQHIADNGLEIEKNGFGNRKNIMAYYISQVSEPKNRLTLQNFNGLIQRGLIPKELEMQIRIYNFTKYIKEEVASLKLICRYNFFSQPARLRRIVFPNIVLMPIFSI